MEEADITFDFLASRLSANAEAITALLQHIPAEQARWRPRENQWSLLEVINHLADEETEDFRRRLDLTLHAPDEPWPPIDPEGWVAARDYASRDLQESVQRFLVERSRSINRLESLHAPDWQSTHTDPRFEPLRAGDLAAAWIDHDLLHIRQILRLQHAYLAQGVTPFQTGYAGGAWEDKRSGEP